ncbi:MAG: hypothetical protein UT33_C0008G0074 [Candidatus Peregrinibacteria bacterium GW2011_GWC2_39_14]|nr:MAG: hypothetical protein US92_C0004G0074 [Candidatus Peregrinibacteria bacterium GW2011_GWA2_38_36]KKR06758.1 MAG: hypothetical protein UT33_C0008G0074 [Candidatus Peregrinibacteria bacterium GW2011_GWC2_39_14]
MAIGFEQRDGREAAIDMALVKAGATGRDVWNFLDPRVFSGNEMPGLTIPEGELTEMAVATVNRAAAAFFEDAKRGAARDPVSFEDFGIQAGRRTGITRRSLMGVVIVGLGLMAVAPSCAGMFSLSREERKKQEGEEAQAVDHMMQTFKEQGTKHFVPVPAQLNGVDNPHTIGLAVFEKNTDPNAKGKWNEKSMSTFAFIRFKYTSVGIIYSLEVNGDYSGKKYQTRSESEAIQYVHELVQQYYMNQI